MNENSYQTVSRLLPLAHILIEQHLGTRHNQKKHANKYGKGDRAKVLERLKGDKAAIAQYKKKYEAKHGKGSGGGKSTTPKDKTQNKETKQNKEQTKEDKKFGWRSEDMRKFEEKSAGLKHEEAAVYDKNGKPLFKNTGTASQVTFTDEQLAQMKGAVVTHNHPSGSSFSATDIELMTRTGAAEIRVATPDYFYSVRPRSAAGYDLSKNALNFLEKYKKETAIALSGKYHKGKWTQRKYTIEYWHEVWSRAAADGWIDYERMTR